MFNPITASQNIVDEFVGYMTTQFPIDDKTYARQFREELRKEGAIAKGPFLDISDSFRTGVSLEKLIEEGEASALFRSLEPDVEDAMRELPLKRPLYLHQENALRRSNEGRNLIVTTGTGSGKTECFMLPVINSLLREAEAGTLCPGVRAILIYPMNALANDQMKRMRSLLKEYPQITFGIYNGSTEQAKDRGIQRYGKMFRDAGGGPMQPRPNELVSREQIQAAPPHILLTNYAMLEYIMLRPKDDAILSEAHLQYLVLDEAHVYRGATGIETAMLLARVKARISTPSKVQHILTSATLGGPEDNDDIVRFGKTLCGADFTAEDIIRSERVSASYAGEAENVPPEMFAEIADAKVALNVTAEKYGRPIPEGTTDEAYLYDLCTAASLYRDLRAKAAVPISVPDLAAGLDGTRTIDAQDIANIVSVASRASKDGKSLLKARYHMFIKAPEGAYITVGRHKKLTMTRRQSIDIDGETYKVFECAVCSDCGRIALVGRVNDVNGRRLEQASDRFDKDIRYYIILNDVNEEWDIPDSDEEPARTGRRIEKDDYRVCTRCGAIVNETAADDVCACGSTEFVKVREKKPTPKLHKCKCNCASGSLRPFYLGYDAATAVLATSLYEELPESERVIRSVQPKPRTTNIFARSSEQNATEVVQRARQFLIFSDSRSEAAYFASYMNSYYQEFLRRRGMWHVAEKNREIMQQPWEIKSFVQELTSYFDQNRTFAEPGDTGASNLTAVSAKHAWVAVLNEMVNGHRTTGLPALGVLKFEYKGNTPEIMEGIAGQYGITPQDAKALFDLMIANVISRGVLRGDVDLTDDDREYIYYTSRQKVLVQCKNGGQDKNKSYLTAWCATADKNGKFHTNGQLARVMKILGVSEKEANGILEQYWEAVLTSGEAPLKALRDGTYVFNTNNFTVTAGPNAVPLYRCDTCGKLTMINCRGRCSVLKCDGHLVPVPHKSVLHDNHFARLYQSQLMHSLHIREHTAQLGRDQQQKYQEMFVRKDINALSCSTTFELGVDVGDLETVYLRNMPPTPANYAQRAGRAGRRANAGAFSLTYAKLSSHDFTYFASPLDMITGRIKAPVFNVENEKILRRHMYAVALSDFFRSCPDVYNSNDADVLLNKDGWERLCAHLDSRPQKLQFMLEKAIPEDMHECLGIKDYSWTEKLIGEDGVLTMAVDDFRKMTKYYEDELRRLLDANEVQKAAQAELNLKRFRRRKDDGCGRNELIEFLVRNNVLPKYGFPVDTVELHQNANFAEKESIQMARDLQIAVSEYAPGSEIVADGKMYTSRYIRKVPQTSGESWERGYVAECPECGTWNRASIKPGNDGEPCVSCRTTIPFSEWKIAIEPRRGFTADVTTKTVPLTKPDKTFRSDECYIGDPSRRIMKSHHFVTDEGLKFSMETTTNDALMVLCNDDFFVCNRCGYAQSVQESGAEIAMHPWKQMLTKAHGSPWGKECNGDLIRYKLSHVFRTDVVRIVFDTFEAKSRDTMLSVMYALLEATAAVLDIERNDIKGCLHLVECGGMRVYSVVLYDAVAGGAGHVRRMVTDSADVFSKIVQKAIEITKGCNCDPSCYSCLRNYQNQKIHDRLDRHKAYRFLEAYRRKIEPDVEKHEKL